MVALFADLPEATDNSVEIALRCAFRVRTRKPILPRFASGRGAPLDEVGELRAPGRRRPREAPCSDHGCAPGFSAEDYRRRLDFELDVIVQMKFPGYFLIVADFIQWAKRRASRSGRAAARAPARWSPTR